MTFPELLFSTLSPIFNFQVFPLVAPDSCVPPYAVYTQVGSAPSKTLADGVTQEQDRYQIDVYATGFAECFALSKSARTAILAIPYPVGASLIDESYQYESEVLWHRAISEFYLTQSRSAA